MANNEIEEEFTTQKVRVSTLERIKAIGSMGDSFDDVVVKLLDLYEKKAKK